MKLGALANKHKTAMIAGLVLMILLIVFLSKLQDPDEATEGANRIPVGNLEILYYHEVENQRISAEDIRTWSLDQPAGVTGIVSLSDPDKSLMAVNSENKLHYLLCKSELTLYWWTEDGTLLGKSDLNDLGILNPQRILFAPSGDGTDEAEMTSLYLLDQRGSGVNGELVLELALYEPAPARTPIFKATLLHTIHVSQFLPNPSPDPSSVEFLPGTGGLMISDCEVDEMTSLWIGKAMNLFETDILGNVLRTSSTRERSGFTGEPTGLAMDAASGRLYVSDDDVYTVFITNLGSNGIYDNSDPLRSFSTLPFGCTDPEGLAFDSLSGTLYIIDGLNEEVFGLHPGENGVIEGFLDQGGTMVPLVDDWLSQFDTTLMGVHDPEGIAVDPDTGNLYLCGYLPSRMVLEVTPDGVPVRRIDVSEAGSTLRSGLGIGPSSIDPGIRSLYLADRGIDNFGNPDENDGKIYELALVPTVKE